MNYLKNREICIDEIEVNKILYNILCIANTHTHTHTHTQEEQEQENIYRRKENQNLLQVVVPLAFLVGMLFCVLIMQRP